MMEQICGADVCVEEAFEDLPVQLFPEEAKAVADAIASGQREFGTVRRLARRALQRLDMAPVPVVPDAYRAPIWPNGVVGSMTHCEGFRAAALARTSDVLSIGIDAEPDRALPPGVLELISLVVDREAMPTSSEVAWDRLLFCAKEAVFKAWFPLTRTFLDFHEASVRIDRDGGFEAELLVEGPVIQGRPLRAFHGNWVAARGFVATAIVLPVH